MEPVAELSRWMDQIWTWGALLWGLGGFATGVFFSHLAWFRRVQRLGTREKEMEGRSALLDRRQKEVLQKYEELSEREGTFRRLEETLKLQSEQLKPQIDQIRSWVDQIAQREETLALREAALERKTVLGETSVGG